MTLRLGAPNVEGPREGGWSQTQLSSASAGHRQGFGTHAALGSLGAARLRQYNLGQVA